MDNRGRTLFKEQIYEVPSRCKLIMTILITIFGTKSDIRAISIIQGGANEHNN